LKAFQWPTQIEECRPLGCDACKSRRFGGMNQRARNNVSSNYQFQLLVIVNDLPSSLILFTLKMEATFPSVTSVLTRATWRHIPEDGILHSHRRENLKSYITLTGWSMQWRFNLSPVKYELGFYIPQDDILHSHRRENLKSYIILTGLAL
jgi:hypothetical protein